MNSDKSTENGFSKLKSLLIEYFELRLEHTKLSVFQLLSIAGVSLISAFILILLVFFFLFFLFIALGFYLGTVFNNTFIGFGIIAGFYLLLILLFLFIRKKQIERPLMNKIIESLTSQDENKD